MTFATPYKPNAVFQSFLINKLMKANSVKQATVVREQTQQQQQQQRHQLQQQQQEQEQQQQLTASQCSLLFRSVSHCSAVLLSVSNCFALVPIVFVVSYCFLFVYCFLWSFHCFLLCEIRSISGIYRSSRLFLLSLLFPPFLLY